MSSPGSRPGGLTALAVLNFVFGGLGALGILALLALFALVNQATDGAAAAEATKIPGAGLLMLAMAVQVVVVILLITSGVGYLKQKKMLGKTLGTVYGGLAIAYQVIYLLALGQPFGLMQVIGFIYPTVTLLLLNTVFKDDFINP